MSPYLTRHDQTCRRWMSWKLTHNSHKRSWTNTNSENSSNTTTQTTLNAASSRHRRSDVVQTQPISISLRTSSNSPGCLTALLKGPHNNAQWELVEFHRWDRRHSQGCRIRLSSRRDKDALRSREEHLHNRLKNNTTTQWVPFLPLVLFKAPRQGGEAWLKLACFTFTAHFLKHSTIGQTPIIGCVCA